MEEFKKEIIRTVGKIVNATDSMLEIPPDSSMGDLALPCFSFAKDLKKNPADIAKKIEEEASPGELIEEIKAFGPYVNFFINKEKLAELTLKDIVKLKHSYGKSLTGKGKTIMVEYSSPSLNKPQHLGHVRNNVLGFSLSRIFEFSSYKVIKANLMNDRGIHICQSMLAYKEWGENKEPDKKPDHFVGGFYVMFHNNVKEKPELQEKAQQMLRKWEQGDKEILALWKKMNNWVYKGFQETYNSLGVDFDIYYHESEFYHKGKKIIDESLKKGLLKKSKNGAIYADLEEFGLPEKYVLRADGTTVYTTQDIYLAKLKFEQYDLDKSLYVVASEHNLYLQQLFAILKKMGFGFADKCYHRTYGMVFLPEGKMKSREGTVVDADDSIGRMKGLAKEEVEKRYEKLGEKEKDRRAKAIGLAGLKFYMLKQDPVKDIYFDPRESISFEGETGPYIQYAFARICSILRKFGKPINENIDFSLVKKEEEINLIKHLDLFYTAVEESAKHYDPSKIAHYLTGLAQMFNNFYHNCPVLSEREDLKKARLLLAYCTKQVLGNGISLLGIETLEEM